MLTFLIPVRHPGSVPDWGTVRALMATTLQSVAAQTDPGWVCYLAAERGTDLPPLPAGVRHAETDIAMPDLPDLATDRAGNYAAVKRDKGARALAALEAARADGAARGHVMVVDYDDLVSRRLADHAAAAPDAAGWHVDRGYLWSGGDWAILYPGVFHKHCGTSQIVHARHMPGADGGAPDIDAVDRHLGSHMFVTEDLAAQGTPMAPLGFPGAVYRIGHGYGVSRSRALWRRLVNTDLVRRPRVAAGHVAGLRRAGARFRAEFLGAA